MSSEVYFKRRATDTAHPRSGHGSSWLEPTPHRPAPTTRRPAPITCQPAPTATPLVPTSHRPAPTTRRPAPLTTPPAQKYIMLEPNRTRLASASRGRYAAAYKSITAAYIVHFAINIFDYAPQQADNAHYIRTYVSFVSANALYSRVSLDKPPASLDKPPGSLDKPPVSLDKPSASLDKPPASLDRNGARAEDALTLDTSDFSTTIDFGRSYRTCPAVTTQNIHDDEKRINHKYER